MERSVFIDSGAFIARVSAADQHHEIAKRGWESMRTSDAALFSSEPVLIESANFLTRNQGGRFTADWIKRHLNSSEIRWLQPNEDDFRRAWGFLEKFADRRISFTDAISFSLMHRHDIRQVFGFDRHFALAGFQVSP